MTMTRLTDVLASFHQNQLNRSKPPHVNVLGALQKYVCQRGLQELLMELHNLHASQHGNELSEQALVSDEF